MSLGARLILGVAVSVLVGLVSLLIAGFAAERATQEKLFINTAASLVSLGAESVSAAAVFEDSATARKLLSAYGSLPEAASMSIILDDGRQLATWQDPAWSQRLARGTATEPYLQPASPLPQLQTASNSDAITAGAPIIVDGETYGTLIGVLSRDVLARKHERAPVFAILGAVFAMLLAIFSAWLIQKLVTQPILETSRAMRRVAMDADYSDRIFYAGNDALGVMADSFNVMAKRMSERERLLEAALLKAEKAAQAKQLFLANMSHEIRTPMNVIIGGLYLAIRDTSDAETKSLLQNSHQAAASLMGLINDILDLSKIETGHLTLSRSAVTLSDMLTEQRGLMALHAEQSGLTFNTSISPDADHTVLVDHQKLTQILTNLSSNATKYTLEGGVSLEISLISATNDLGIFRFLVRDTGIGIDEATQAKLFEPFYQAEDARNKRFQGTGLGLSISQSLASALGGRIEVDSVPSQGSVFWMDLELPLLESHPVEASENDNSSPHTSLTGTTVLLVDDTNTSRLIVRALLEAANINVLEAANGPDAIAHAHPVFGLDVILMDIQMPEMDGIEATKRIQERYRELACTPPPVIALTAYAFNEDRIQFLEAGMDGYLSKPVDPNLLYQVLSDHIT